MKNQNGITLIKFCIIVIVVIIAFIICIDIAIDSYKIYNLKRYLAQMDLIQEKVISVRNNYKNWNNYNPNETGNYYAYMQELGFINANSQSNLYVKEFNEVIKKLDEENNNYWNKNIDVIITNYCYFTPESLKKLLGVENTNLYVIINFYTGNVISRDGIEDITSNKVIHREYDASFGKPLVINDIYNVNNIPKLEIIENRGLSQKVKISLESDYDISEIYYYLSDNNETKEKCSMLSDYTYVENENSAYFTINVSGKYEFIVEDTNFVQYNKIEKDFNLCNPPILIDGMKGIYWNGDEEKEITSLIDSNWYNYSYDKLQMANAKTEDGNYWVWIPRFSYKETKDDTDIKFILEDSITTTLNKSQSGYKIQEAFLEDGNIQGFWVLKFQSSDENSIFCKPGETLSIINKVKAENICNTYINNLKASSMLISTNKLNSILMISNSSNIKISNNLVHYAGGGTKALDYIENTQYSSTRNVYGVYDLVTSENELLKESNSNEFGRFRAVIFFGSNT